MRKRNWSLKIINNKMYLYTWSYRNKHLRTKRKKQRFTWKYRGEINSRKAQQFILKLPIQERQLIEKEQLLKWKLSKQLQQQLIDLKKQEPFKTRHENIMKVKNRLTRIKQLKSLENELKIIIKHKQ